MNGQHGEVKVILNYLESFFGPDYRGIAIDIGASDGIENSNTLYFETIGWKIICIEPNPILAKKCKDIRRNVLEYAVGNMDQDNVEFTIFDFEWNGWGNQSAISSLSIDSRLVESTKHLTQRIEKISVNVRKLDTIIESISGISQIDWLSIDTESTELNVLKGFDILKWKPKLMVIENNFSDSDIEIYLNDLGYEKEQRLVVNDFYILKNG